jgi:hypothetical protein
MFFHPAPVLWNFSKVLFAPLAVHCPKTVELNFPPLNVILFRSYIFSSSSVKSPCTAYRIILRWLANTIFNFHWAINCPLCGEHFSLCLGLLEWHSFMLATLQNCLLCVEQFTLYLCRVIWLAQFYARCATNCSLCVELFTPCLGLLNFTLIAL